MKTEDATKIIVNFFEKLKEKVKLPKIAEKHPVAFWVAVVLHVTLLFGLIFATVPEWQAPKQKPIQVKAITQAVTVDLKSIEQEKKRLFDIEKKKDQRILDLKKAEKKLKKLEDERYKKQQRINKLKELNDEAEKRKNLIEEKKKETEKEIKEALSKANKEKKILEQKTKEVQKKKELIEQETKEAEKKKRIADEKAKAAEKIRKETEIARKKEKDKFKKEQSNRALKKDIQAEEDQDRVMANEEILNELKDHYMNQIASRVREKWRYDSAEDNWTCQVYILQSNNGIVESVNLQSCEIEDSAKAKSFKASIERAVYKASPLPPAPDQSVFDREVLFTFRVN